MASSRSNSREAGSALALAFLILAAACAGALPARAADCPTNYFKYAYSTFVQSDSARYTLPLGTDFGEPVDLSYDLVAGMVHEHSFAGLGGSTWVRVSDLYDVAGVAPGTPVLATAELLVDDAWVETVGCGGTGCWGFVYARIVSGPDSIEASNGINVYESNTKVSLTPFGSKLGITFTAGTPIPLTFRIEGHQTAGGSHATDATARIRFSGLPAGASVVSCQGYVDPSTPARPSSWGRLKAAYR